MRYLIYKTCIQFPQSAAETASFPAYGDDSKAKSTSISISGQESTGFQYSQNSAGREEDFPVSSSSSAPKFVVPAGRSDVVTNLSATREASQSSVVSSAPATATPVQQPVVPQVFLPFIFASLRCIFIVKLNCMCAFSTRCMLFLMAFLRVWRRSMGTFIMRSTHTCTTRTCICTQTIPILPTRVARHTRPRYVK